VDWVVIYLFTLGGLLHYAIPFNQYPCERATLVSLCGAINLYRWDLPPLRERCSEILDIEIKEGVDYGWII
jgi:hypothetical protein